MIISRPQVIELNLADNRILVIPPAIGEMWQLQELKLDHNKVFCSSDLNPCVLLGHSIKPFFCPGAFICLGPSFYKDMQEQSYTHTNTQTHTQEQQQQQQQQQ